MSSRLSRRTFAQLAAAAAIAPTTAFAAKSEPGTLSSAPLSFPRGFLWGSATASYQVEGAVKEDGRGPSIWDTFSHIPGKTHNGDTGDVADDHYHRFPSDIALMKDLGLKSYRFSVAWPRIFPIGTGTPNSKGLDFYSRLVDGLLAAGVQPFCTLYHWDLPQALEDKGGWQSRDTAQAFAAYAGVVADRLSDRVKHFMTFNEMRSFIDLGYGNGIHAPGLKLAPAALNQARHHAVLAHGLGVQAIRAHSRSGGSQSGVKVGLAENITCTVPVIDSPDHVRAATIAMREENAGYLTVMLEGRYTDLFLSRQGANAPKFTAEELRTIAAPLDFVGINCYTADFVRASTSPAGYAMVPYPKSYPHMLSPWLRPGPEALYWAPKIATSVWNIKEIYITENGTSSSDVPTPEGAIYDIDRISYLRNYLTHLHRAVSEGVPIRGYFLWSLLDNYEWADGYNSRFGIHYVDFATQKRTPKLSARFYREVIARNALA